MGTPYNQQGMNFSTSCKILDVWKRHIWIIHWVLKFKNNFLLCHLARTGTKANEWTNCRVYLKMVPVLESQHHIERGTHNTNPEDVNRQFNNPRHRLLIQFLNGNSNSRESKTRHTRKKRKREKRKNVTRSTQCSFRLLRSREQPRDVWKRTCPPGHQILQILSWIIDMVCPNMVSRFTRYVHSSALKHDPWRLFAFHTTEEKKEWTYTMAFSR